MGVNTLRKVLGHSDRHRLVTPHCEVFEVPVQDRLLMAVKTVEFGNSIRGCLGRGKILKQHETTGKLQQSSGDWSSPVPFPSTFLRGSGGWLLPCAPPVDGEEAAERGQEKPTRWVFFVGCWRSALSAVIYVPRAVSSFETRQALFL